MEVGKRRRKSKLQFFFIANHDQSLMETREIKTIFMELSIQKINVQDLIEELAVCLFPCAKANTKRTNHNNNTNNLSMGFKGSGPVKLVTWKTSHHVPEMKKERKREKN